MHIKWDLSNLNILIPFLKDINSRSVKQLWLRLSHWLSFYKNSDGGNHWNKDDADLEMIQMDHAQQIWNPVQPISLRWSVKWVRMSGFGGAQLPPLFLID